MDILASLKSIELNQLAALKKTQDAIRMEELKQEREGKRKRRDTSAIDARIQLHAAKRFKRA
jgi:hypothetical protein